MYVMTSDYGASSSKRSTILDYAELIVLNKFDKRGAEDALRDVAVSSGSATAPRSRPPDERPGLSDDRVQFNDPVNLNWMFANLCRLLRLGTGDRMLASGRRLRSESTPRSRKARRR